MSNLDQKLTDDPLFLKWIFNSNPVLDKHWNDYLLAHPEEKEQIFELREQLSKLRFSNHTMPISEKTELKNLISEKQLSSIFCKDKEILNFLKNNGINCSNEVSDFTEMQAGITSCEFLVARTGSVVVSSAGDSGRSMNVFPPIHLVLANSDQLVQFPEDALVAVQSKYKNKLPSTVTTITGPSRTADIEKTLVLGAHGPKELVVFLSLV